MRRIVSLPVLAALVLLGASCSQQVQQPVKKAAPPPVYVGKVEQVYPNHHYVLIALAGNVYEPGTVLISQSPGREEKCRVANLIVTEERMGRAHIPADIRSGAVEAGDLVFLYRNLAVPESSGKMDEQKPVGPEPDEDSKVVAPPIAPNGGRTADGLMPLPGDQPVPASADQERISREREKILRELESVPDKLEEPW
ncbi:hypothetical protein, partial [uncultured Akkermansia sp.]